MNNNRQDHQSLLAQVAKLLGGPVRFHLRLGNRQFAGQLQLQARHSLAGDNPIVQLCQGPERLCLEWGFCHYRLAVETASTEVIDLVKVSASGGSRLRGSGYDFWAVRCDQFDLLDRTLQRQSRAATHQTPPILPEALQNQLLENTIGFLLQGAKTLARYGVALKRGVLLYGEPGNGKTMACRWLRWHCRQAKLGWKAVSAEEYDDARGRGCGGELFQLTKPGIIQFDDFDHYFRDREQYGAGPAQTSLLAELDGLQVRRGVVYLFTTNSRLAEMDPAFRRPGRIDCMLEFHRPDVALRQRFIETTWHADLLAALDVQQISQQTAGLSFAEMDELKKLLVLGYLDRQRWDWPRAWQTFSQGRADSQVKQPIGFGRGGASCPAQPASESIGISACSDDWSI